MFRYLVRRLLWAVVLFLAVTIVTYVIFFLVPANPARLAAGQSATPEVIAEVEEYLGLNDPVYVRYWTSSGGWSSTARSGIPSSTARR